MFEVELQGEKQGNPFQESFENSPEPLTLKYELPELYTVAKYGILSGRGYHWGVYLELPGTMNEDTSPSRHLWVIIMKNR